MILSALLSTLVIIPAAILCILPMKDRLKYGFRRTALRMAFVLAAVILVLTFLQVTFHRGANDYLIPLLCVCFVLYHFSLDVHISQSLAFFAAAVALLSILTNLALCVNMLYHPFSGLSHDVGLSVIQIAFSVLALAFLARPYRKSGSTLVRDMTIPKVWYITVLLSAGFFAINMLLSQLEEALADRQSLIPYLLFTLIVLLVLWLLLQALFVFSVSESIKMGKAAERLRILELQESQFAAQQRYIKATEQIRHDFRQSVQTLSELYEAGDYEALGEYLRQYVKTIPSSEVRSFCENTALNALLNYYVHLTDRDQIRFTVRVSISGILPVSDVDLCSMVGNILENAVVACQRAEERFIQLSILTEANAQLFLVAVNSYDGHVRQKNGKYLSTNRSGEGLGILSISSTAEKYGGTAQFSHDEKSFYSNVAIPL